MMTIKTLIVFAVLIAAINAQTVYISGYSSTISAYTPDSASLQPLSTSAGPNQPSFMAFHPTLSVVYAIDESASTVTAYTIGSTGSLTKMNSISSGGSGPAHISVHPSGKWIYTTNYGSGHLSVATTAADGSIGTQIFNEISGTNAHQAITDPLGKYLFVVCKGSDYIVQYVINSDGTVTRNNPATCTFPGGSGPRHIAFHPSRNMVYLITELSNQVITLTYTPSTGTLYGAQALSSLPSSFTGGSTGGEIQVSSNGAFVYASNRGHNSIGIWSVKNDGTLTSVGWETGGGDINVPRHFSINPSGTIMYVANQNGNSITIFSIVSSTGLLNKATTMTMPTSNSQPSFVQTWTASSTLTSTSQSPSSLTSLTMPQPTSNSVSSTASSNQPSSSSTDKCANKDAECQNFCGSLLPSKCECDSNTGRINGVQCETSSAIQLESIIAFTTFAMLMVL
eukprot:TRINITY_DN2974_c0_g1_i1.p1 TRINITY_DN2974_c0_g1~~TRINITY_DN2974_c0_g1_i1.p1  ORF type:complete len:453 (-),score=81.18 TRINITY_DN2974_c0_g1_i1:31-1389(-)